MVDYGRDGLLPEGFDDEPYDPVDDPDSAEPDSAPDPWYRNRVLLALWAVLVALLLALIIYGVVELSRGGEGTSPATSRPSTSPTRSSSTTTTPSTTSTAPETPEQTPAQAPPPNTYSPAPSEAPRPHHHWHLPHLPHGLF